MCGILGSINVDFDNRALDYLKHRGPDDFGMETFMVNQQKMQFGHRRLSIIDLSPAGHQPMKTASLEHSIIFNGEIYNHEELRMQLPGSVTFKGYSDTETLLYYIKEFGIQQIKDLNGIFAFAFLDFKNHKLHLARDRFGVKPLYYYFDNNQLLFSSELRPLKAFLKPVIEKGILMNSLRMRYTPSPSTIYSNIYKVEPGQLLTFDLKTKLSLSKSYFVPIPNSLGSRKSNYKKLINEYGDLFEKAVERQLMADVEVGILLSGGVDSALVASIAKQKSKKPVKAFTIGFDGKNDNFDEIEYARETASVLGLEHFTKKISFTDLFHSIREIVEIVEEPIATTSIIPMYFLSELAASKVKVVLSGQGADEPLGGYNKYRGLKWLQRTRSFSQFIKLSRFAQPIYKRNEHLRRLWTSMQYADNLDSYIEFNSILSLREIIKLTNSSGNKLFIQSLLNQENIFKQTWRKRSPQKANIQNLFLYYDLRTSLADDLLMYTDKITMHFSLECRVPILDNDLIDFIESLNTCYKFNSKNSKIIHKDFAKEYLPSSIIDRKKLAFKSPTESWFRENNKEIEELLTSDQNFSHWFDLSVVKKLLSSHRRGRNMEKQIFLLLSIYHLLNENSQN